MKKIIFAAALFLTAASGAVFAQSTTISTSPKEKSEMGTDSSAKSTPGTSSSSTTGDRKTSDGAQHSAPDKASQAGRDNSGGSRVKPGGEAESGQGNAAATAAPTDPKMKNDAAQTSDKKSRKNKSGKKDN